jgi:hypothetical protein
MDSGIARVQRGCAAKNRRVGKANGSRECAPDDRLRVPTFTNATKKVGTALSRLCPPYAIVVIA